MRTEAWAAVAAGATLLALAAWAWWRRVEVSAWTGLAAIEDPQSAIQIARASGVARLCIFVNDRSFCDGPFRTYPTAAILDAVATIHRAGLKVTLVSWMTPDDDWIVRGARELAALAERAGADEIELDLEEPWTVVRHLPDEQIDAKADALFHNLRRFRGRVVVDFIVGVDLRAIGPCLSRADAGIPQAYWVAANGDLGPKLAEIALRKFSPFRRPLILGMAAYWQSKPFIPGRPEIVRAALDTARALGFSKVRFWRLEMLNSQLQTIVAAWARRETPRAAV